MRPPGPLTAERERKVAKQEEDRMEGKKVHRRADSSRRKDGALLDSQAGDGQAAGRCFVSLTDKTDERFWNKLKQKNKK